MANVSELERKQLIPNVPIDKHVCLRYSDYLTCITTVAFLRLFKTPFKAVNCRHMHCIITACWSFLLPHTPVSLVQGLIGT